MNVPDLPAFFSRCIEREESEGYPWDETRVHSSDLGVAIGEACPRQLWLRVRQAPRKPDSAGKRLMFLKANAIHKLLAGWMEQHLGELCPGWRVVAVEELVENEGTGRLDVLIEQQLAERPTRVVVDFKSMRGAAFKFLDGPKPAHVIQVQDYIRAKDAVCGVIVYTDREGQNGQRQYVVPRADAIVQRAWMEALHYAEMPDPAPKIAPKVVRGGGKELPWQCTYCGHFSVSCNGALTGEHDPTEWRGEDPRGFAAARLVEHYLGEEQGS